MNSKLTARNAETFTMKEVMKELLDAYRIKDKFNEAQLVASWEKLMGAPIAKRTNKVFIKNKVMFVELNSAPLKHELNHSKSKILDIFRREFGDEIIREIIFI